MLYSRTTINKLNNWLTLLLVGFLVLAPLSPVFVLAQEEDPNPDGNNFSETIQNDPASYVASCISDPTSCNIGPNDANDTEDTTDLGQTDVVADDGVPGPNDQPGPDAVSNDPVVVDPDPDANDNGETADSGPGPNSTNTSDTSSGFTDTYTRPTFESPEELNNLDELIDSLPRTVDEARAWHDEHFDEQAVATGDVNNQGDTTTTTGEPDTTAENNASNIDDSVVGNTASSTTSADISSDQTLDQENVTAGAANSGNNVLESDKDVLEGTITTGDAGISSDDKVKGNTTNVSTGSGGSSGWIQKLWGSDASNNVSDGDDSVVSSDAQEVKELTILNKNLAFVSNIKELLANTGGNRLSGVGRVTDSGIFTGAARAKSSLLNIINTNTVDSAFLPLTFDIFDDFDGNINILEILFNAFGRALNGPGAVTSNAENNDNNLDDSIVSSNAFAWENIDVTNENEGYIYNDLDITGISGRNQALANRKIKQVDIQTGRVDVTNNLINFLNTNLFKSKVGVVVINVFADWMGNLIVPGASQLATQIPDPTGVTGSASINASDTDDSLNNALSLANSDLKVISKDEGDIQTDININANTGLNYTSFAKDAENVDIRDGSIDMRSNILTLANRNIVGTAFSQGFFNILGDWTGSIVGTPNTARVQGSGNSVIIADSAAALTKGISTGSAQAANNSNDVDDSIQSATAEVKQSVTINNNNTGKLVNKLDIVADSGTNDVAGYKGQDINVDTGDVGVTNNIANFMNSNFAFTKGLIVSLNVFGKWRGNVAYDEVKDLAVDIAVHSASNDIEEGDQLDYNVTAVNTGTQPTDPDTMTMAYDDNNLELVSPDGGEVTGNTISWPVPQLESAEKSSHSPSFLVKDLPDGEYEVAASVSANQNDVNTTNNKLASRTGFRIGDRDTGLNRDRTFSSDETPTNSDNSGNNDQPDNSTNNNSSPQPEDNNNNSEDSANLQPTNPPSSNSGSPSVGSSHTPGYLVVDKEVTSSGPYAPGDKVSYTVTVANPGDTRIDDAVVYDSLRGGDIEANVSWPIDYVDRGEEVTIEYEITVQAEAPSGDYTNNAYASGFDAADAVIKSNIASTVITVVNASAGTLSADGAAGAITDEIGVIEEFNPEATSSLVVAKDEPGSTTTSSNLASRQAASAREENEGSSLSEAELAVISEAFEADVRGSSRVSRYIAAASAAEGVYLNEQGEVLGAEDKLATSSEKLAYAVYPNFLHFDGMPGQPAGASDTSDESSIFSSWVLWLLFVIALAIGYLSYREKKNKRRVEF